MLHIEATPWCIDAEDIIRLVPNCDKSLVQKLAHIDSQDREDCIRVQGVINELEFLHWLLDNYDSFNGDIKHRSTNELLITYTINK